MTRALTGSAADREAQRRIKRLRLSDKEDIHALMQIAAGRRFIMRLLDELQPRHRKMFATNAELQRNVVLHDFGMQVRDWLDEAVPLGYLRMLEEKAQREMQESDNGEREIDEKEEAEEER